PLAVSLDAAFRWPVSISAFFRLISASSRIKSATCSSVSSSPGTTITARAAPTGASSPSGTPSQRTMPVAGASTSFVAFSLSICTMGSPSWTESPGRFNHSTTSPVFIANPHLGMLKIVATLPLLSVFHPLAFYAMVSLRLLSRVGSLKRVLLAVCFTCFICFTCFACSTQTWAKRNADDHEGRYGVTPPQKPLRTRRGGGWVVRGGDACVALVRVP